MKALRRKPSPATAIALVALAVAVFGTVQGSWAAGSKATKSAPTVGVKISQSTVPSGAVQEVSAPCPSGSTVIGGSYAISGSVLAHASSSEVKSQPNVYAVEVTNPPGTLEQPAQDASVLVGAICAKNSTPIIVNGRFSR